MINAVLDCCRMALNAMCSPAVAQTGGDTVDAKMNGLHDALVALGSTVALEQLDLDVMQRVDIRKSVAY